MDTDTPELIVPWGANCPGGEYTVTVCDAWAEGLPEVALIEYRDGLPVEVRELEPVPGLVCTWGAVM